MHKLPTDKEGPIDILFLTLTEWITPPLHAAGHTPNIITTYSLLAGLASGYYLWKGYISAFSVLFLVSYLLDCVDGYMARRYDQITTFGDYYDHVSDIAKFLVIMYVFVYKYPFWRLSPVLVIIGVILALSFVYLGCSQHHYKSTNSSSIDETLDMFLHFSSKDTIHWVKYCSTGTLMVATVVAAIYLEYTCVNLTKRSTSMRE
jgi:phosphatidylglycerophosphate synthase